MHLLEALGIENPGDLDPTRPINLGPLVLGSEASAEAALILAGGEHLKPVSYLPRAFDTPVYWSVNHKAEGEAELFGFPHGVETGLPTALEIAIVRATAMLPPDQHIALWSGGLEVVLGSPGATQEFRRIAAAAEQPMAGVASAFSGASQAIVDPEMGKRGRSVGLNCLTNSYKTTPLKFRFLELYRVMEALFLADVKSRLLDTFDKEPASALAEASEALKSELKQVTALAEANREPFEECWTALNAIKNTNQFSAALFRRLKEKGSNGTGRWSSGAALIYQIRCAVVHAGAKDIIFESFIDGDVAVAAVLPAVERAALQMLGFRMV